MKLKYCQLFSKLNMCVKLIFVNNRETNFYNIFASYIYRVFFINSLKRKSSFFYNIVINCVLGGAPCPVPAHSAKASIAVIVTHSYCGITAQRLIDKNYSVYFSKILFTNLHCKFSLFGRRNTAVKIIYHNKIIPCAAVYIVFHYINILPCNLPVCLFSDPEAGALLFLAQTCSRGMFRLAPS